MNAEKAGQTSPAFSIGAIGVPAFTADFFEAPENFKH
jgi:hypothetical protein